METITFYTNFKNGRFFVSGKNENEKWFSLWKNPNFNKDLYLNSNAFKGGKAIDKKDLELLKNEDGTTGKVLVFKNAEVEKQYCISKEEIEKQKNAPKFDAKKYIDSLFYELLRKNPTLEFGELINNILKEKNAMPDAVEEEVESGDLPF